MKITDPSTFVDQIDMDRLRELLRIRIEEGTSLDYVEPGKNAASTPAESSPAMSQDAESSASNSDEDNNKIIIGKVQRLGDFIDTDALAPAEALTGNLSNEELGKFCLKYTHPEFRDRSIDQGLNVVVGGKGFGVGSSRENAVTALQGAGIQCVIARSFAFIYARNQPSLGLLGIVMTDEDFYATTIDGANIEIDVDARRIKVGGKQFEFALSDLELQLWQQGGLSPAFAKWGKGVLKMMTAVKPKNGEMAQKADGAHKELNW
jgi:3-isopropylmalate dehydratase small subunit